MWPACCNWTPRWDDGLVKRQGYYARYWHTMHTDKQEVPLGDAGSCAAAPKSSCVLSAVLEFIAKSHPSSTKCWHACDCARKCCHIRGSISWPQRVVLASRSPTLQGICFAVCHSKSCLSCCLSFAAALTGCTVGCILLGEQAPDNQHSVLIGATTLPAGGSRRSQRL